MDRDERARLRAAAEQATPGMMVVEAAAVLALLDELSKKERVLRAVADDMDTSGELTPETRAALYEAVPF